MTAADPDDPDDDPLLTSMRSVWLGMRDEDPPDRGLAELMAAARTQAAAMKPAEKQPWWRRSFVFLLRPPVLAAAAVVVLIGGAVALKGRGGSDNMALPQVETGLKDQEKERAAPEVAPANAEAPKSAAPDDTTITEGHDRAQPPPTQTLTTKPKLPPKPTVSPTMPDQLGPTPKSDVPAAGSAASPPPPPPPPPPDKQSEDGLMIAGESNPTDGRTKRPAANHAPREPEPSKADADEPTSAPKVEGTGAPDVRAVSTEQLIKQAETAAGRNDCAAVRITVARIKKASPDAYKTRVANQPAIARCLK